MATSKKIKLGRCSKSEISYDTLPHEQVVILHDYTSYYGPTAALNDNTPLQFDVTNAGSDFIDPSDMYLKMKVKITKANGDNLASTDKVAPVNHIGAAMFSQFDFVMNNAVISQPTNMHHYKSYLHHLTNLPLDVKNTMLFMEGWHSDQAGSFDDAGNTGFVERAKRFALSKEVELKVKLHTDLGFQQKLIPNNVHIRITLTRAKNAFCLQSHDTVDTQNPQEQYKLTITHAELQVRKVRLEPGCQLEIERRILHGSGAHFPINHIVMKCFNIPTGSSTHSIDSLFEGQRPNVTVMGLVPNENFNGTWPSTPWNFQHHNVNFLELNIDGQPVPSHPLQPDYAGDKYMDAYETLYRGRLMLGTESTHGIKYGDYKNGNCLYIFNLTADKSDGMGLATRPFGQVNVALRFTSPTTETLTLVVFAEFSNIITIFGDRQVAFDYAR